MKRHPLVELPRRRRPAMRRGRNGSVIVLVIAFLVLVTALGSTGMRRIANARQWNRVRSDRLQNEELIEAGLQRFSVKIKNDVEFQGDDWAVDVPMADEPGSNRLMKFVIRTTQVARGAESKSYTVRIQLMSSLNQELIQEKSFEGEMK